MKITKRWLKKHNACKEGLEWFEDHTLTNIEYGDLIKMLIEEGMFDEIWWLLSHLLKGRSRVNWGCYCARLVLPIWEEKNPEDNSLRHCIEVAENPESTSEELNDADSAASWVADASSWAGYWDASAAYGIASAAAKAAFWAAYAASAAKAAGWDVVEIKQKMIDKALQLIKTQDNEG